jgi:hypothetical protein
VNLDQAVDELTRVTKHAVRDAAGVVRIVDAAPLLVQLRMEITNASGGGGGGSSKTTAAIPLAAAALDLLEDIKATVNDQWWQCWDRHHGHGRGTLVGELRTWASVSRGDPASEAAAAKLCVGWAHAIKALLQPVRRWEIVGACPKCKATRTVVSLEVGETVYAPALCLEFAQGGAEGVCRACGETFDPQVLALLLAGG